MKCHMSAGTAASPRGSVYPALNLLLADFILRVSHLHSGFMYFNKYSEFLSLTPELFDSGALCLATAAAPPRQSDLLAPPHNAHEGELGRVLRSFSSNTDQDERL